MSETNLPSLRTYDHATQLFGDSNFRLLPKTKFLFHVAFGLNSSAVTDTSLINNKNEINMLVKSADLPTFDVQTETLNQYNRHKIVQYRHKFNDITIKFHDDNASLINKLWQNYYKYYYADPKAAKVLGAYDRNAMKKYDSIKSPFGFNNGSTNPFFTYIKIYHMARTEYVMYELHNPLITKWSHSSVAYSGDEGPHENIMTIAYEAVSYSSGIVKKDDPLGFAVQHYDLSGKPKPAEPDITGENPPTEVSGISQASSILTQIATYQSMQTNQDMPEKLIAETTKNSTMGFNDLVFALPKTNSKTIIAIQR